MNRKRWILLVIFIGAALLSGWLFPTTGLGQMGTTDIPGRLELSQDAIQAAAVQAAISLPLWEEDNQLYLPLIKR